MPRWTSRLGGDHRAVTVDDPPMLILDGDATSEAVVSVGGTGVFVSVGGTGVSVSVGGTGVFVGVGVGGRTVIVTLPSSLPPKVLSCTEDEPPAQPYTVSDASSGSSQRPGVPEHRLLLHKTWPLVITHLVDSDAGLQPPVTSTKPPTPIVVADALTQPRGSGVTVGVTGVGVGVTGVGDGVTGVGVGVTGVGVGVMGVGVGVGGRTVIVTLPSSLPPKVLSCTEDEPPAQPYTESDASSGSSQRPEVPEHRLLLHKTWPLVITHLVDSDAGLQPPVTSTEPPTPIVVADALTQPRGSGVAVGVTGLGVGVTGVGDGVTGVGDGVTGVGDGGSGVGGTGVGVSSQTTCQVSGSHSQPPPRPLSVVGWP